ncbi:hypothetical protein ABKA04_006735 [Annulohypoxylon sp. FPYF3050]
MSSINAKPTLKLDTSQSMPPPSNTDNPKPKLKLNTAPTPSREKIKINLKEKLGGSQPGTPAATSPAPAPTVTKSKAGRTSKPTKKLIESKKRGFDSDDEDRPMSETRNEAARPSKMIKIKNASAVPATPVDRIRFKPRGEPIEHRPGDGYDSEASDREHDPIRESTFIIRTLPDPSMDYLRKAIEEGTMGVSKQMGGADFGLQFLDVKSRRAVVTIDGNHYAAVLVQLPTITEATKTWDKKNMMKNSDISEMLLCFEKVKNEAEAKTIPLPEMVVKNDYKWPHGLTPPMHDAVHRRFRKTLSEKQWQTSAARVAKLLEDDAAALETHVEVVHDDYESSDEDDEEDAEGEIEQDYFGDQTEAMDERIEEDDELFAAMEAALNEDETQLEEAEAEAEPEPVAATSNVPLDAPEAPTPMTIDAITPAPAADEPLSEEDEDEDEEDEDDEDDEDVDEEQLVAERERKEKLDELEHLNKSYEDTLRQLAEVTAPILKRRILTTKANLEKEISVKKAALGLTDED